MGYHMQEQEIVLNQESREDRVRLRAYEIWVEGGRLEGRDEDHWLQACAEVDEADEAVADFAQKAIPQWLKKSIDRLTAQEVEQKIMEETSEFKQPLRKSA
jgi:hypothetical protein